MHPAVFRSFAEPLAMARTEKFFHADVSGPPTCVLDGCLPRAWERGGSTVAIR